MSCEFSEASRPESEYPGLRDLLATASKILRSRYLVPSTLDSRLLEWSLYVLGVCYYPSYKCNDKIAISDLGYFRIPCQNSLNVIHDINDLVSLSKPTPLVRVRLDRGWPTVWVKLEWFNPYSLSIKDRTALELVIGAKDLVARKGVVEVSSGNTGIALSALAASIGLEATIVLPSTATVGSEFLLRLLGARVLRYRAKMTTDLVGIAEELARREELFFTNQFQSDFNLFAHIRGTGRELVAQSVHARFVPSVVVAATGTSGTVAGVMFTLYNYYWSSPPRFYVVSPRPGEKIEGARHPSTGAKWLDLVGVPYELIEVTREEALNGLSWFARRTGLVPGVSGGSVVAGLKRLVENNLIGENDNVVIILPDHGIKYVNEIRNYRTTSTR